MWVVVSCVSAGCVSLLSIYRTCGEDNVSSVDGAYGVVVLWAWGEFALCLERVGLWVDGLPGEGFLIFRGRGVGCWE